MEGVGALVAEGVAQSQARGTHRVLVDHRNAEPMMDTMEIYQVPLRERDLGAGPGVRVALVMPAARETHGDFQFYEDRAVNVGATRRVFADREAALAWLVDDGGPR